MYFTGGSRSYTPLSLHHGSPAVSAPLPTLARDKSPPRIPNVVCVLVIKRLSGLSKE